MWPSRLLLLCMRPARETRARRGWATVSGLLVLYFLYTVRLFRKKDMWVKIFRPARARFAQLAPVKFLGRVRYVTHRETLSAPSPRRRHASRRASSWQGGCRARRARATGAREPRCDGGRAGAFHPAINFPTPGTGCAPLANVFSPRARLRRASRRPPGFDRAEFPSDCCRECSGRESERTRRRARSAHEDSTRGSPPIPWATQPSGRETSFARSRPRPGHIATRARARRPIAPRVFSPEVPSRYARKTRPDRDSRTPFSRGGFPAARSTASQLERRPARRNFSRLFLVCPNSRLTDTPIDPPYQSAGSWFRHFSRRRYPRARYRTRHGSRAQGARGSRGGEGFLRPLRLSQAGAYLAARPDRRQIPPNPPRRTRLEPCR